MLRFMNTIKARKNYTNAKNNHLCANEVQVIGTQNGKFNRDSHANSKSGMIDAHSNSAKSQYLLFRALDLKEPMMNQRIYQIKLFLVTLIQKISMRKEAYCGLV